MKQFDVFRNPVPAARRAYPFVVVLLMSLTTLPARSLRDSVASLSDRRDDILAAIDYFFFGV